MITVFGIKNCDSVKKSRRWLEQHDIPYRFHDFRSDGISAEMVNAWIAELGWEVLLNRRGRTWREIPEKQRIDLDPGAVCELMVEHPTLIKRPVLDLGDCRWVGFDPARYEDHFSRI